MAEVSSETSFTEPYVVRRRFPADFRKACHILWLIYVRRITQTEAAILVKLNVGTVNHIVHGRRFPDAYPVPFPGI